MGVDDRLRAKMAALSEAAEVAEQQTSLAANVRQSMERIDAIMEKPATAEVDDEVEAWRRKIEALSQPVTDAGLDSTATPVVDAAPAAVVAKTPEGPAPQPPAAAVTAQPAPAGLKCEDQPSSKQCGGPKERPGASELPERRPQAQ